MQVSTNMPNGMKEVREFLGLDAPSEKAKYVPSGVGPDEFSDCGFQTYPKRDGVGRPQFSDVPAEISYSDWPCSWTSLVITANDETGSLHPDTETTKAFYRCADGSVIEVSKPQPVEDGLRIARQQITRGQFTAVELRTVSLKSDESNGDFGTRAKGTERLVYRILQSPEYRTREIVTQLLEAALPTADRRTLPARAQTILDRIEKYGESAIPKNELDLVSWSDLAVTGVKVKGEGRRKTRHFRPCK